jgi:hypothetical protein
MDGQRTISASEKLLRENGAQKKRAAIERNESEKTNRKETCRSPLILHF